MGHPEDVDDPIFVGDIVMSQDIGLVKIVEIRKSGSYPYICVKVLDDGSSCCVDMVWQARADLWRPSES